MARPGCRRQLAVHLLSPLLRLRGRGLGVSGQEHWIWKSSLEEFMVMTPNVNTQKQIPLTLVEHQFLYDGFAGWLYLAR